MPNITDCHRRYVPLELPPGARFFHRHFNNMTATDYGPVVQAVVGFDADHPSQNFLIAGDVENHCYILIGAVTAPWNVPVNRPYPAFRPTADAYRGN